SAHATAPAEEAGRLAPAYVARVGQGHPRDEHACPGPGQALAAQAGGSREERVMGCRYAPAEVRAHLLWRRAVIKKQQKISELKIERPKRANLSAKESLKRMREFSKRKEKFVAAVHCP